MAQIISTLFSWARSNKVLFWAISADHNVRNLDHTANLKYITCLYIKVSFFLCIFSWFSIVLFVSKSTYSHFSLSPVFPWPWLRIGLHSSAFSNTLVMSPHSAALVRSKSEIRILQFFFSVDKTSSIYQLAKIKLCYLTRFPGSYFACTSGLEINIFHFMYSTHPIQ